MIRFTPPPGRGKTCCALLALGLLALAAQRPAQAQAVYQTYQQPNNYSPWAMNRPQQQPLPVTVPASANVRTWGLPAGVSMAVTQPRRAGFVPATTYNRVMGINSVGDGSDTVYVPDFSTSWASCQAVFMGIFQQYQPFWALLIALMSASIVIPMMAKRFSGG